MTPEGKVKAKVKKILNDIGCFYFFPASGGYGKSGVPDIIICHQGKFIAIECKANANPLTALQKFTLEQIELNGGLSLVINEGNIHTLLTILKGVV